ncbi:MAG: NAD(P)H-dependent oxidoreductase [Clostridia bacterium]|nr:NAD(P)H-dependent oxidoreductase [Clostridia bacterium]
MILYINACVRKESRTEHLAKHLLARLGNDAREIRLIDAQFPKVDDSFLAERDRLLKNKEYNAPMFEYARDFASADSIVIAAPFWDLSFPAILKQYFEQINVTGITFQYTSEGIPQGLCKAKKLYYVTTAGGTIFSAEYGYGYVKALANSFYGIQNTELIKAEGLDIYGANVAEILKKAEAQIDALVGK